MPLAGACQVPCTGTMSGQHHTHTHTELEAQNQKIHTQRRKLHTQLKTTREKNTHRLSQMPEMYNSNVGVDKYSHMHTLPNPHPHTQTTPTPRGLNRFPHSPCHPHKPQCAATAPLAKSPVLLLRLSKRDHQEPPPLSAVPSFFACCFSFFLLLLLLPPATSSAAVSSALAAESLSTSGGGRAKSASSQAVTAGPQTDRIFSPAEAALAAYSGLLNSFCIFAAIASAVWLIRPICKTAHNKHVYTHGQSVSQPASQPVSQSCVHHSAGRNLLSRSCTELPCVGLTVTLPLPTLDPRGSFETRT